eukprot:946974-Pyramimonas_sp.AAC.1
MSESSIPRCEINHGTTRTEPWRNARAKAQTAASSASTRNSYRLVWQTRRPGKPTSRRRTSELRPGTPWVRTNPLHIALPPIRLRV